MARRLLACADSEGKNRDEHSPVHSCTRTRTLTSRTHAYIHTYLTHIHMHTHSLLRHVYTHAHAPTHTHTHHTRARTHTLTTYLYTLSSQINVSAHTCIRTRTRARTLTHTLTHTNTPTTYIHLQAYFSRENTTTNRRNMRRQRHVCLVSPAHSSQSVLSSYFGNESCFGPSASPRDAACKYVRLLAGRERWARSACVVGEGFILLCALCVCVSVFHGVH